MFSHSVQNGLFPVSVETVCSEAVGNFVKKESVDYPHPLLEGEGHVRNTGKIGIYGGANVVTNDLIILASEEEIA